MSQINIDWCDSINDTREPKNYVLEIGYDRATKYYFYEKKQAEKYFKQYEKTHHVAMYEMIKKSW